MNSIDFYITSILFGVALAMDAFSCSIADGLALGNEKKSKSLLISCTFSVFQTLMPFIGYFCVRFLASIFQKLEKFIPYIALILLLYIGIKMIVDGIKDEKEEVKSEITFSLILLQGIATSIDALSVGFTISDYRVIEASIFSVIIGIVTFIICTLGVIIGKKVSNLTGKATIFGGVILILIGLEIFIKGVIIG